MRIQLVRNEVRTPTRARASDETEQAHVDAAAETVVEVILKHRRDIAQARIIAGLLLMQRHEATCT